MVAFPTKFNYGRGNYHTRIVLWEIDSPSHVTYRSSHNLPLIVVSMPRDKSLDYWVTSFQLYYLSIQYVIRFGKIYYSFQSRFSLALFHPRVPETISEYRW
jgi:hypothetical protein